MGLRFEPSNFHAHVTVSKHRSGFTETELTELIGQTRLYFDLSDCTVLIVNAYAYALQEKFNILATKTIHHSRIRDISIYGPAILVNCEELSPSVKTTMRLQGTTVHE